MHDANGSTDRRWPFPRSMDCPFDPPPALAQLRESDPFARIALYDGGEAWLATRYNDIKALLQDREVSADGARPGFPMPNETMADQRSSPDRGFLRMDSPDHMRQRRPLQRSFTVGWANDLKPQIASTVDSLLDQMEAAGEPSDLMAAFANPVPASVTCAFLSLPFSESDRFLQLVSSRAKLDREVSRSATASILTYFDGVIDERIAVRGDDLVSQLITEQLETGILTRRELRSMLMFLLVGGFSTTANMIALGTLVLLTHPEQLEKLRDAPSLWKQTIEELLRYLTVAHWESFRLADHEFDIGGEHVVQGDGLILPIMAANRDPEVFENPDQFDIERDARAHLAFGSGVHQCLGQALARTELEIALPRLFSRFPDLSLAVPVSDLRFNEGDITYGVAELPLKLR
jgi:cytochrome P450